MLAKEGVMSNPNGRKGSAASWYSAGDDLSDLTDRLWSRKERSYVE